MPGFFDSEITGAVGSGAIAVPGLPSEANGIPCGNDRVVAHALDLVATDREEVDRIH